MNILNFLTKNFFSPDKNFFLTAFCVLFLAWQVYAAPGRLDLKYPQILASGANVTAIATQTDGKILIAGEFVTRGAVVREDMIRLNTDGSLDTTFNIGIGTTSPNSIKFIKIQPDGKILIAGYFGQIGGTNARSIARLNTNGSVDTTFNLSGIDVVFVRDLDIQTDGKILISATNLIGTSFITRLNYDGTNEPGIGQILYNNQTFGLRLTYLPAENKIMVGGRQLARLNINGGTDMAFSANITSPDFNALIIPRLLANGKYLVFGHFDTVNGVARRNIAVLNSDGTLDTSFNPATTGAEYINDAVEQTNGKILIGGTLFALNSPLKGNLARLNADGTIDKTFNQGRGASGDINALKILSPNSLLIGGSFLRYHIFPRGGLAKVSL